MRYSIFSVQDHHPSQTRSVANLYAQVIEEAELADRLGYDTFFVAEHHFHEYGVVPNPAVFLSTLAQRTKRIRLAPAISILTFHHPLTVAENYAMVDLLSGGRLTLGVGSGYLQHEFDGYAVASSEKRGRFDEHLLILEKALRGERFSHTGKFITVDNVQLNVPPTQPGGPPIYVAILRSEAAYHIGKQGRNLISVPYASAEKFDDIAQLVSEYNRGYAEAHPGKTGKAVFAFHTHVADTDEEARRNAEEAFNLYVRTRLYAKQQTYDDIQHSGLGLFGSPETVAKKISALKKMGVDHVMLLMNFGLLDQALVKRSMELFVEKVIPLV